LNANRIAGLVVAGLIVSLTAESAEFVDVAAARGVRFVHSDYRTGEKYYPETTASGGGWIDFDGDGDLDLYLLQGAPPPDSTEMATGNVLFENRNGTFHDVTETAGVGDRGFGMGLCVGDADGNGSLDLFVTNFGPDRLYLNQGDRTFKEEAESRGVAGRVWSSSCAFADLDGDGDLDLYVSHYVEFDYATNPDCGDPATRQKFYCQPSILRGLTDSLFINDGSAHFTDEARGRGLAFGPAEKGLGVLTTDLDHDGDIDIYVANDGTPNRLYVNDGAGVFEDQALLSGVAVHGFGESEASMGVDIGDLDNDGRRDLVVTHFAMETNTLYWARSALDYDDRSRALGFGPPSLRLVSWGIQLFDADNDGDLDVATANGHIEDDLALAEPGLDYRQGALFLENLGDGRLEDASKRAGSVWGKPRVGRGLAAGDYNNDGRVDLLLTSTNGPAELLENRSQTSNRWLGLVLAGPAGNRQAIRAVLRVGDLVQTREVRSGGSFQSQPDLRMHFGLGAHEGSVEVEIRWPDGTVQVERTEVLDRYWQVEYRRANG
jgi:enediyne biosynthesis protein E4